ncbi:hypothetical protein AB3S75_027067 [Citrus x aurantiifolia]
MESPHINCYEGKSYILSKVLTLEVERSPRSTYQSKSTLQHLLHEIRQKWIWMIMIYSEHPDGTAELLFLGLYLYTMRAVWWHG